MGPFCTLVLIKHLKLHVMKIRKKIWIVLLLLPFLACNDPDKTIETNTTLQFTIPLHSNILGNTSSTESYSFTGYATVSLVNKNNVQILPGNILQVTPGNGSVLIIPNLASDLNSLQLVWGYGELNDDVFNAQSSVDLSSMLNMENQELQIDIDEVFVPIISQIDSDPNTFIKVMLIGNAGFQVNSVATLEIPVTIKYEVMEVRFTL